MHVESHLGETFARYQPARISILQGQSATLDQRFTSLPAHWKSTPGGGLSIPVNNRLQF